jgi:chemotaxis protein MotB
MAMRTRRHGGNGLDAWPGYVDALSTLLMVIIFVLLVFVLAQAFLTATLAGRNETLAKVRDELAQLSVALSVEKDQSATLERSVEQLSRDLANVTVSRDALTRERDAITRQRDTVTRERDVVTQQRDAVTRERDAASRERDTAARERDALSGRVTELDKTVRADKATIEAKLSDLSRLDAQTRALQALLDELEQKARTAAAATLTEKEKRAAAQTLLAEEKNLGESARAQIALLNRQVEELKAQFASVQNALGLAEQEAKDKDLQIANLGQKLNAALVKKVEDLQQYRSEFFGKLRALLANRPGIVVVGDRFVFQSEVLFPVGSAELTPTGIGQMADLAASIKDIAKTIPPTLPWVLRVDGHTDPQPLKGGAFASNWELSAARAIIVVKLLVAFGVPPERLAATGFGEYQPFAPGDTPDVYAKDRRIELRLTDR